MVKQNNIGLILVIGIAALFLVSSNSSLFVSVPSSTIQRQAPNSVMPGSSFNITYSADSVYTKWGVSITDTISGGCTFQGGSTNYKTTLFSVGPVSETITINTPSSASVCKFSGDYQFGNESIKLIQNHSVQVGSQIICNNGSDKCEGLTYFTCSNNAWISQGTINGRCGYNSTINETAQTYYRLSNNNCSAIVIYSAQKTANDYLTLSECQSNINAEENFWSKEILNINGFSITGLLLVIFISMGLLLIKVLVGK